MFQYLTPIARDRVVESMSDAVIVVDMQARLVDMNPAAQKLVGRSLPDLLGQPIEELPWPWPDQVEQCLTKLETHTQISLGQGASLHYYDLHTSPLYAC